MTPLIGPFARSAAGLVFVARKINDALAPGQADRLGSLEPGKIADLIVIDQDIVGLVERGDADLVGATRVLAPIFDGAVVFV